MPLAASRLLEQYLLTLVGGKKMEAFMTEDKGTATSRTSKALRLCERESEEEFESLGRAAAGLSACLLPLVVVALL